MRTTRQFSITLPNDMAALVEKKVAAGQYASESEVIRDGLRLLLARDQAMEEWLRNQVGPSIDALRANPKRVLTVTRVRQNLARARKKANAKPR